MENDRSSIFNGALPGVREFDRITTVNYKRLGYLE
jgi:hypothetical protein